MSHRSRAIVNTVPGTVWAANCLGADPGISPDISNPNQSTPTLATVDYIGGGSVPSNILCDCVRTRDLTAWLPEQRR